MQISDLCVAKEASKKNKLNENLFVWLMKTKHYQVKVSIDKLGSGLSYVSVQKKIANIGSKIVWLNKSQSCGKDAKEVSVSSCKTAIWEAVVCVNKTKSSISVQINSWSSKRSICSSQIRYVIVWLNKSQSCCQRRSRNQFKLCVAKVAKKFVGVSNENL